MDEGSRGMLDSYKSGIDNYVKRLGPAHPKIVPLLAFFVEFEKLGEASADYGAFHEAASAQNYYGRLTNLMTEAAMAQPTDGSRSDPTVADAAKGYHAAYASLSAEAKSGPAGKAYERIFQLEKECDSAIQFMRRLAEEHLLTDISRLQLVHEFARAQQQIKDAANLTGGAGLSVPATDAYLKSTIAAMQGAKSITEVEYLAVARAEIAQLATLWDNGFCNAIYHAFGSALSGYKMAPTEENRQRTENLARFIADYFGCGWQELHQIERVWNFFSVTLWPSLKDKYPNTRDAEGFRDYLKGTFDSVMKDKAPLAVNAANRTARFWGEQISLAQVYQKLLNPPDILA